MDHETHSTGRLRKCKSKPQGGITSPREKELPKTRNNDAGQDAENGEPPAPQWERRLVQPRWKAVRRFLKTFKLEIL